MAEDKTDPSSLRKKQSSFWISLMVALFLMALSLATALYYNASQVSLLTEGIQQNVDLAAVGLDNDSVEPFAVLTLAYLRGHTKEWELYGMLEEPLLPVSGAFMSHMATLRSWFAPVELLLFLGLSIVLLLLPWALYGFKRNKDRFSFRGYYTGALVPLVFIVGVGLWGAFDFEGLWNLLHMVLIPDGLFSAAEPIMQLFPVQLFAGYAKPVAVTFGIMAAVVLASPLLPCITSPSSKKTTSASK